MFKSTSKTSSVCNRIIFVRSQHEYEYQNLIRLFIAFYRLGRYDFSTVRMAI